MGLDMYLDAEKSIYKHDEDFAEAKKIRKKYGIPDSGNLEYVKMSFEIAYWRKDNHIHKWFVDNCADGEDDCQDVYVSKDDLQKLLDTIKEVLADKNKAEELLPTQSGFFFGSTEYNEDYWESLTRTQKKLEEIIENENLKDFTFQYRASW